MARLYAGILGPLALATSVAHGILHARQTDAILLAAWCSLLAFAVVGGVLGGIAGRIIEESVGTAIAHQLAAGRASEHADKSQASAAKP